MTKPDYEKEMIGELESLSQYREALRELKEEDRDRVRSAVKGFLGDFARELLEPLAGVSSDEKLRTEFVAELRKRMRSDGTIIADDASEGEES